ncbi:MAG: metal ABC transporter substrate-binding protein [Patescibacteria group bacterium]|nr:metal ABC transporter substrate-binding protein [Patescibacteria group bacterium]
MAIAMKKSLALGILIGIVVIVAVLIYVTSYKLQVTRSPSDTRLQAAATINPLADMVSQIGGEYVNVATILPPGSSPHTFEPAPEQINSAQNVKLFFAIGHGLDSWLKPIVDSVPNASTITVDHNIQLRDLPLDQRDADQPDQTVDPHYWLTVTNAKVILQNIADALIQADPIHKDVYAANLSSYLAELDQLDKDIKAQLSALSKHELITHHNAWGYFADAYGLKVVGTFEVSPGKEPTPQQIADLQNKVKQYSVSTIFSEPQLSDQSLKPFVQDLNLKIAVLDPEGGINNMGYIDLMRYNADTIANALK